MDRGRYQNDLLLTQFEPTIVLPPCDYSSETVNVVARCVADLRPMFPYLNAVLPAAQYQRDAGIIRFRYEGHVVTMKQDEIAAGGFEDGDAAIEMLARLQKLINETWARRDEIEPSYVQRTRPKVIELYRLLPGSNCRRCGQATCFIFASKLISHEASLGGCPVIFEPEYRSQREQLQSMLELAL